MYKNINNTWLVFRCVCACLCVCYLWHDRLIFWQISFCFALRLDGYNPLPYLSATRSNAVPVHLLQAVPWCVIFAAEAMKGIPSSFLVALLPRDCQVLLLFFIGPWWYRGQLIHFLSFFFQTPCCWGHDCRPCISSHHSCASIIPPDTPSIELPLRSPWSTYCCVFFREQTNVGFFTPLYALP